MTTCPCYSGKDYEGCCAPFHKGKELPNKAEELMRSRYAAYALGMADYIMDTTHPENPLFKDDREQWISEIHAFSKRTSFEGLEIKGSENDVEGSQEAYVTFTAVLKQGKRDGTFTEKSYFEKVKGKWLYRSGVVS